MRSFPRIAVIVLLLVLLIAGALFLIKQKQKQLSQAPEYGNKPRVVSVARAEKDDLLQKKDYLAVVRPGREANVSTRVSAEIEEVRVDEGDRVESGDILLQLDAEEVEYKLESIRSSIQGARADLSGNRATVKSLQSSYKYWKAEKKRNQELAEKGAVSRSEAERIADKAAEVRGKLRAAREKTNSLRNKIASLRAQKKEVESSLDYYRIKSPYNGVVSDRLVDQGDLASPSKPLLKIEDRRVLKLVFDIPQEDLDQVVQGQDVLFTVNGEKQRSELSLVHPSLDQSRMKRAEVWLQKELRKDLSSGAYLPVSVVVSKHRGTVLVPRSALIPSPQGKEHVFAVEDGRLRARPVEVLGQSEDRIAVEGIEPKSRVVKSSFLGWDRLSSGEKVEVVE